MWELDHKESWALKNWCFWTVVLEKTLESPRTARSNQPILTEISPEYSLEGLMMGKIEGRRRKGQQRWDGWMASLTQWTWVWASSGSWWWTRRPGVLQSVGSWRVGHDWVNELNWMWGITVTDFWALKQPCITGKFLLTEVLTFFIHYWIYTGTVLLGIFCISAHEKYWPGVFL